MGLLARLGRAVAISEWLVLFLILPLVLFPSPSRSLALLVIPLLWVSRRSAHGHFVPATPLDWPLLFQTHPQAWTFVMPFWMLEHCICQVPSTVMYESSRPADCKSCVRLSCFGPQSAALAASRTNLEEGMRSWCGDRPRLASEAKMKSSGRTEMKNTDPWDPLLPSTVDLVWLVSRSWYRGSST